MTHTTDVRLGSEDIRVLALLEGATLEGEPGIPKKGPEGEGQAPFFG